MDGTVAPGATFENAHELPNSTARPGGKHVAHRSDGNGVKKPRKNGGDTAWDHSKLKTEEGKASQAITEANKKILVITPHGRRFVNLAEYRRIT
jgi:hypothetical protein